MFMVTVTRSSIAHKLQPLEVKEFKVNSSVATVATDGFLSRSFSEPDGFSVIESPLLSSDRLRDVVFSTAAYRKEANLLEVHKSTMSGRPVYYHLNPGGEFFCSTHISMLRKAGVTIEENAGALPEFFVYRYVMPPRTLYKNIHQLVAGSRLSVALAGGECLVKSVDDYIPPEQDRRPVALDEAVEQTLDRLAQSIEALGPGKDRLAVLLSGGLDSSTLFRLCQARHGTDATFSAGYPFEDPAKNVEKANALSAAKAFNAVHKYYEPSNRDYVVGFVEAIKAAEMPLHHLQSVMYYLLFKNGIPGEKNIIVSGEGAEGPFGWMIHKTIYDFQRNALYSSLRLPARVLFEVLSGLRLGIPNALVMFEKLARISSTSIEDPEHIAWSMGVYGDIRWVQEHFGVKKEAIIEGRHDSVREFINRPLYDLLSILCLYGEDTVTQAIWSKIGEGQGRVLYYPYESQSLLDYAYSIPWPVRLAEFKNVLRGVARRLEVPEFIVARPKSSFGVAHRQWARSGGVLEPLVPLASKEFDIEQIRRMQSTDPEKAMLYWGILNYSIWKRLCVKNEPAEHLLEELPPPSKT